MRLNDVLIWDSVAKAVAYRVRCRSSNKVLVAAANTTETFMPISGFLDGRAYGNYLFDIRYQDASGVRSDWSECFIDNYEGPVPENLNIRLQ